MRKNGQTGKIMLIGAGVLGALLGGFFERIYYNLLRTEDIRIKRLNSYYDTLSGWLNFKQKGKKMDEYLMEHGYRKIAIYALGEIGVRLFYELKGTGVSVEYAIDQNIDAHVEKLKVVGKEDKLEEVDAVIVSVGFAYEDVKKDLEDKLNCPILSLQNLVYEIALIDDEVY